MNFPFTASVAGAGGRYSMSILVPREKRRDFVLQVLTAVILGICFLNPLTERLEYGNAILFMFSHYALFLVGFCLSYRIVSLHPLTALPGLVIAVIWHFPVTFAVSGAVPAFRVFEESTIALAGFLIGSSLDRMPSLPKSALTILWFCSDTALSVLFIVLPGIYYHSSILQSAYTPSQFVVLGVAMIFFMNAVIAFILYRYVRKLRPLLMSDET